MGNGLPWWLSSKDSTCQAGDRVDPGLILGLGRSPGEGNGSPLQYSCLRNPMDRGAWRATVHGVALARSSLLRDWFPCAGAVLSLAQAHRGRPQTTSTRLYAGGELQGSPVWQALAGHKRSFPLAVVLPPPARGPGTLIPSAQRLVWAAKQPLGNAAHRTRSALLESHRKVSKFNSQEALEVRYNGRNQIEKLRKGNK